MKLGKAALGLLLIFALHVGLLLWGDRHYQVLQHGTDVAKVLPWLALVSLVSYGMRYARWHGLLVWMGYTTPWARGFLAYLSGFAFTATPGKVGELVRIRFLQPMGVASKDVISAFILERALDLVAVLALSLLAVGHGHLFWLALVFVVCFVVLIGLMILFPAPLRLMARAVNRAGWSWGGNALEHLVHAFIDLRRWTLKQCAISFAWGLAAWIVTSAGFLMVLHSLQIQWYDLAALSIYPLAMLVGAASMLPGGVGSTEAAIVVQLQWLGVPTSLALLAAMAARIGTMWFAILLGFLSILKLETGDQSGQLQSKGQP